MQPSFSPRLMFRLAPSFEGFVASLKNLQYNFPKIHLFWKGKASLKEETGGSKINDKMSSKVGQYINIYACNFVTSC